MSDFIDRRIRRHHRLRNVAIPSMDLLDLFQPDELGRIDEVTRKEAQSRELQVYASPKLGHGLDKVFVGKDGLHYIVRYTVNGVSIGEQRLAKAILRGRELGLPADLDLLGAEA